MVFATSVASRSPATALTPGRERLEEHGRGSPLVGVKAPVAAGTARPWPRVPSGRRRRWSRGQGPRRGCARWPAAGSPSPRSRPGTRPRKAITLVTTVATPVKCRGGRRLRAGRRAHRGRPVRTAARPSGTSRPRRLRTTATPPSPEAGPRRETAPRRPAPRDRRDRAGVIRKRRERRRARERARRRPSAGRPATAPVALWSFGRNPDIVSLVPAPPPAISMILRQDRHRSLRLAAFVRLMNE